MKTSFVTSLILASTSLSFAGTSPKQAIVPVADIPNKSGCPECLNYSGLFIGGGIDYLFQTDAEYVTGQVGYEWGSPKGNSAQSVFLEVGWLESNIGISSVEALPITLNYSYKRALTRCLNFYIGGGAGVAFSESEGTFPHEKPLVGDTDFNDDEANFVVQAFAGLTYCVTESIELYGGVRYIWSDGLGIGTDGLNDFSIGAGLRYKF